ncbi:MAG: two-component system sensor histidine kinase NtrB [Phycisphaerales bacterium]
MINAPDPSDTSHQHSRNKSRSWLNWIAPPLALIALAAVAAGSFLWRADDSGPLAHMRDLGTELTDKVRALADNGLRKTVSLADDPRLPEIVARHDRAAAEEFANDLLARSLELDIVAIFDKEGKLLAVNTKDHDRKPIERSRVEVLYSNDFSHRNVIQSCLTDTSDKARMEFQTKCDFTPPIFGSSGLSVAFSAPIPDPQSSRRLGVVSTRLNFQRVTNLAQENSFVRSGNSVFMISDDGHFFDEDINAGRVTPPLDEQEIHAALGHRDEGRPPTGALARLNGEVLLGVPAPVSHEMAGGGLNVVLRASEGWVKGLTLRSRLLAGTALLGSLVAIGIWILYAASRDSRYRALGALAEERTRTSLILESAGEGVLAIDPQHRISYANPAACDALQMTGSQLIGSPWSQLAPSAQRVDVSSLWHAEETQLRRADGAEFTARVTIAKLPGETGSVVTFLDLTAQKKLQSELLVAMRQAGMAEVATGVLHNVGNVLNSVNVAANMVNGRLRKSEVDGVARAGELLRANRDDLPKFLSSDERGKHFADFLLQLGRCLDEDRRAALEELEAVTRGVEHVKHVIGMQQKHARTTSVFEAVRPAELVEEALELQRDSLSRHSIRVERHFEQTSSLLLDKHQVLQILVNLISNAKQAVNEGAKPQKELALSIRTAGKGGARNVIFEVTDNGVGIPEANLAQIFGHGFTTRKDGHGFGLHSAANAAKVMGGTLAATSKGPGCGATFVLSLPVPDIAATSAAASSLPSSIAA